jgi:bifunctional DNA-binding transcriptional regulator/antitoxin component of YhaV-PrlF toxin-antitoxin module
MANGMIYGMKLKMDKSGRIIFPKRLRQRLGFGPDKELDAMEQPGGVLLRPVGQRPSMVQVDGLWVHRGTAEAGANWDRLLDEVREERIQSVLRAQ